MSFPVDTILRALADADRREIVATVAEQDRQDEMPVSDVIQRCSTDTKTLRVTCQHCHFPILAECELIDWERDRDVIAPGPNLADVDPLLTAAQSLDPSH